MYVEQKALRIVRHRETRYAEITLQGFKAEFSGACEIFLTEIGRFLIIGGPLRQAFDD